MKKDFELKAFKLTEVGIECRYSEMNETAEGVEITTENNVKDARPIHSDLFDLFDCDLTKIAGEILLIDETENLNLTGVQLTGKEDGAAIRIMGEIITGFGNAKFKTPRIKYKIGDAPVKAEITVFVERLIDEVGKYLFDGKEGEVEVFGE